MKTDNIYNVLSDYLKRSNKDSTNEVICRFLMNHLMEIPEMSVNEIADACYTSHPSIIRFTKELGYDGFADFKYNVQDYIDEVHAKTMRVSFPVSTTTSDEAFADSLEEWMGSQKDYIVSSLIATDRMKVHEFCRQMHDHSKVILVGAGLSEVILELFRIELARCGKIVSICTDLEALSSHDRKETMVVVFSMNGMLLDQARRNDKLPDLNVYIPSHADSSWLITMKKDLERIPTYDMIVIGSEEGSFDLHLNTAIVFFEMVGNCYQEMFPE